MRIFKQGLLAHLGQLEAPVADPGGKETLSNNVNLNRFLGQLKNPFDGFPPKESLSEGFKRKLEDKRYLGGVLFPRMMQRWRV